MKTQKDMPESSRDLGRNQPPKHLGLRLVISEIAVSGELACRVKAEVREQRGWLPHIPSASTPRGRRLWLQELLGGGT